MAKSCRGLPLVSSLRSLRHLLVVLIAQGRRGLASTCQDDPAGNVSKHASWDCSDVINGLSCTKEVEVNNCKGQVWQFCPRSCDACSDNSAPYCWTSVDVCRDDPHGVVHDGDRRCSDATSGSSWRAFDCDFYDQDYKGCAGYIWQLCPLSCGRCSDWEEGAKADCSGGEGHGGYDEDTDPNEGGLFFLAMIYSIVNCGIMVGSPIGIGIAFYKAHRAREKLLVAARAGQPVSPPDNCCYLFCCGPAAVYYWEGCSANLLIACCVLPFYPLCCWNKTPYPLENGAMVMPMTQAGVAGAVVGRVVQPAAAVVGQPVISNSVAGQVPVITAVVVNKSGSEI